MGAPDYCRLDGYHRQHQLLPSPDPHHATGLLLFLPSWVLLALSIYRGIEAQGSYVAYLVAARLDKTKLIDAIAVKMNDDTISQILYLKLALLCVAVWLIIYIFWWVLSEQVREEGAR